MTDSQSSNRKVSLPCRYYAQGNCRFGAKCKFNHSIARGGMPHPGGVVENTPSVEQSGDTLLPSASSASMTATTRLVGIKPKRGDIPCRAWKAGSCNKGSKCWFSHDPDARTVSDKAKDNAQGTTPGPRGTNETGQDTSSGEIRSRGTYQMDRPCHAWKAGSCSRGENCRFAHDNENGASSAPDQAKARGHEAVHETAASRARAVALAREEAAKTITQVVAGSIVTYSAGANISNLIPGFESCVLQVKNLPNATEDEIRAFLTQHGLEVDRFHLVGMRRIFGGKLEARIVTDAEAGRTFAARLDDGIEFKDQMLTIEVSTNTVGGMCSSTRMGADVLTISWRAPSVRYVAEYLDIPSANAKVRELNNSMWAGRRIKVEMNTLPPGFSPLNYQPNSIKISDLPTSITDEEVVALSGSSHVRRLRGKPSALEGIVPKLRTAIEQSCAGKLREFKEPPALPSSGGVFTVRARFSSWEDAHSAQTRLETRYSNTGLWLRLPEPMYYTLTIPIEQYNAQKAQWNSLVGAIKDRKACMMNVHQQEDCIRIQLAGSVKDAVGALKVRVENLARGDKVDGWHISLGNPGNRFFRQVFVDTGAFLRADRKRQLLTVYGSPKAVEDARELVKRELTRLASLDHTVTLAPSSVGFFAREGISQLKETLGEDKVRFDVASRKVTVTGGEEARHALNCLIQTSLKGIQVLPASEGQQVCPICYDNVSSPFKVGCGHLYCVACLHHFLRSALDSDQFPLVCLGDENRCGVPIAIPTIQHFLPPMSFSSLLETAFDSYIAKHPEEFKFCKTPDCTQIYRSTRSRTSTAAQCPSCFTTVCTSCGEDTHEGLGCEESRRLKDPGEQERMQDAWIASQGGRVRRCPQCRVPIEKLEGCNHMSCCCGAHICWRCMGVFPRATIYEHMHSVHQDIYGDGPNPDPQPANPHNLVFGIWGEDVNIEEQRALLRQAELQRVARQEGDVRARRELAYARLVEERRVRELRQRQEQENREIGWMARHREELQREQPERGWGCTIM